MIKGLIFDLDGVLVFTDKYHFRAWKMLADQLGIEFDEAKNNRMRGISRMDSLAVLLEDYRGPAVSEAEKEELAEKKNLEYRRLLSAMTEADVPSEVRDTLSELRKRGYKLAVGSSSKNARYILERVKLAEAFDAVADGNMISRSKPDPEVFLRAADQLALSPRECAVIEDAKAGIDAAIAGGMTAVAISDAVSHGDADIRLKSFRELLDCFSELT